MRMGRVQSVVLFVVAAVLSLVNGKALLEPSSGSYFGVSIDFQTTNVQSYLARTGVQPVIWNVFMSLPMNATMTDYIQTVLPQIAAVRGVVLLSVEPDRGLAAVTTDAINQLASYITQYEKAGASFMIRYGHEMNGNWYTWGQQPTAFIASHKLLANILRNSTCGVAMVWAPNSAEGYPWTGAYAQGTAESPAPVAGTADFKAMDTDGSGKLDSADDPYLPYYPGDAYVDWVGMSSFHFGGQSFPYTANQQANSFKFTNGFTGVGNADFYGRFCSDSTHQKPMVITETSAMYNPSNPSGQSDFQIKSIWWQQVFNVQGDTTNAKDMSVSYPKVKAVMWFDEIKTEAQAAGALIDWRYSNNQQILAGLSSYIQQPAKSTGKKYWMQLSDFTSSTDAINCTMSTNTTLMRSPPTMTTATYSSKAPLASGGGVASSSQTTTSGGTTSASASGTTSNAANLAGLIGRRRFI